MRRRNSILIRGFRVKRLPAAAMPVSGAFTLLELMIVIAITGIMLATALPPFVRAMNKEGIRKAVSDMVEGCSHARTEAILKGVPTELVIRAEDGQISVQQLTRRAGQRSLAGGRFLDDEGTGEVRSPITPFSRHLADDVAINLLYVNFRDMMEFPEARVRFYPNGTCDEFTVILLAPTGEQKISVDVVTGLADVEVLR